MVAALTSVASAWPRVDVAPFRLSGTVYGTLLNHRDAFAALGEAVDRAPYKGAPKGVVLYLKPRNTIIEPGQAILVDEHAPELEVGAAIGLVMGRTACAVAESNAVDHVAGCLLVADFSVPYASYFRPQVRAKARDRSCALGPFVLTHAEVGDVDALALRVFIDGQLVQIASSADHVRSAARLIADVSEFMTLAPGDVLLTGFASAAPRVRAGAVVAIESERLGRLELRVADASAPAPAAGSLR